MTNVRIASGPIPATCQIGRAFVPIIILEDGVFQRFPRKVKTTAVEAIEYARRVIAFRRIRTNEAKRRLAAISDPWWVEVVADMNLRPKIVHTPVNRDRTAFDGWR
jgi:hypothetical protein